VFVHDFELALGVNPSAGRCANGHLGEIELVGKFRRDANSGASGEIADLGFDVAKLSRHFLGDGQYAVLNCSAQGGRLRTGWGFGWEWQRPLDCHCITDWVAIGVEPCNSERRRLTRPQHHITSLNQQSGRHGPRFVGYQVLESLLQRRWYRIRSLTK